jgi:hypothetical protein
VALGLTECRYIVYNTRMKNIKKTIATAHHHNRISLRNVALLIPDWIAIAVWVTAFVAITLAAI